MKLFKQITSYTPLNDGCGPYSRTSLDALNLHIRQWNHRFTSGEIDGNAYLTAMTCEPIKVTHVRSLGKQHTTIPPIDEIINWRVYEDACIRKIYQDDAGNWVESKAVPTSNNQGNIMNNEQSVVLTTETPLTENKGTTIKHSNQADMTAAIHALTTELESGSITQEQFDILSTSIAEDMVTIESVEPEVLVEPSDWVPTYTLKDRLMDLAFNRALNMCQNHSDRFQVEAILKPLMEATEDGYSPEAWLVALSQISQRVSDTASHFTIARAINLTMRGITLSLNDRLAGQGKGFGTSHDAKLTHAQEELEQAESTGQHEVARMIREDILELELNVSSEQETGTPYAGTSWNNSELPQDYDVLLDMAGQYAMGARRLYTKLNLGQSDDPMKFQVWSVNANIENPNEPAVWVDIETFEEALNELELANSRRNVQRKINAELLSTQVERARLDMSKAARTEKAVAAKKATAEIAQKAIATAKAKMVNNEIQRNLGVVELRCEAYAAGNLTDLELAEAVIEIVAEHDLLTGKVAEDFVVDYCERHNVAVPTPA